MYVLPGRAIADIPVIETARLRLRANHVDDFPAMCAMWQDETYIRYVGNRKRPPGEVWGTLQRNIGSWALFGYGYLSVEDRQTGAFVGECGFAQSRRHDVTPALPDEPEAGWGFVPDYWGKGIALEAMSAITNWMTEQDPAFPSHCIIDDDHVASRKVAEALGYRLEGSRALGKDHQINVFVRKLAAD